VNRKAETARNHQTDHKRGDLRKVPRCGAKTRRNNPCLSPAMKNGRCRLHGGLSTGPRTRAGIERIRQANTRHGMRSQAARAELTRSRELIKQARATLNELRAKYAQPRSE